MSLEKDKYLQGQGKQRVIRMPSLLTSPRVKNQFEILDMLSEWNKRSDRKNWNLETPSPYIPRCPRDYGSKGNMSYQHRQVIRC